MPTPSSIKFNKPVPEFFFSSLLCGSVNYIVPKHVYAGSDPVTNPANNAPIAHRPVEVQGVGARQPLRVRQERRLLAQGLALHGPADHPLRARSGRPRRRDGGGRHPDRRVQSRGAARHQAADRDRQVRRHAQGLRGKRVVDHAGMQHAQSDLRQARGAAGDVPRRRPRASSPRPSTTAMRGRARARSTRPTPSSSRADTYKTALRSQEGGGVARRRGLPEEGRRQALHAQPAGGRLVRRERQDRRLSSSRRWRMSASASTSRFPTGRPRSSASTPTTISTWRSPTRPIRPSRCRSTTQYYTSDGIKKGVPFRNASGFHTDESTRWSRRSRSRPTRPSARRWWSSSRRSRRWRRPTCRWSSSNRSPSPAPGCRTIPTIPTTWRRAGTTYGWRAEQR